MTHGVSMASVIPRRRMNFPLLVRLLKAASTLTVNYGDLLPDEVRSCDATLKRALFVLLMEAFLSGKAYTRRTAAALLCILGCRVGFRSALFS